uniref:Uncharacterized protein n=1 Tax=Rhizophora mucronata TaxID=61149 RepID=A0A2P2QZL3_RHIMU
MVVCCKHHLLPTNKRLCLLDEWCVCVGRYRSRMITKSQKPFPGSLWLI